MLYYKPPLTHFPHLSWELPVLISLRTSAVFFLSAVLLTSLTANTHLLIMPLISSPCRYTDWLLAPACYCLTDTFARLPSSICFPRFVSLLLPPAGIARFELAAYEPVTCNMDIYDIDLIMIFCLASNLGVYFKDQSTNWAGHFTVW